MGVTMDLAWQDRREFLSAEDLQVVYGRSVVALKGISLKVPQGAIVALLGPNGAGKTTTLRAISGMLPSEGAHLRSGNIVFDGNPINKLRPDQIVGAGIVQVPEGRRLFAELSVEDNLKTGACQRHSRVVGPGLEEVYQLFPRLKERRKIAGGFLSGGEQQMVVIGRGIMGDPRILLLDEPSLGLAPQIVDQIFRVLSELRARRKLTILLVEQNANKALGIADAGYIIENGKIVLAGDQSSLMNNGKVRELYLGLSDSGDRRSYRARPAAAS
jgi:branched-chain amino acid transport system ATP-binding protein